MLYDYCLGRPRPQSRDVRAATTRRTLATAAAARIVKGLNVLVMIAACVSAVGSADEAPVEFSRDVLPILSDNCFQCHGPDVKEGRKGDLRLDDEQDVKRDRSGYRVITPGDVAASELWQRVTSSDPDLKMPPAELGRRLQPSEIERLRQWISQGAAWGRHWAFERIERPIFTAEELAQGVTSSEPSRLRNPIDVLVDRVLKKDRISAAPMADKSTLIRRLSLDLTGLPPTPTQLERFLNDESPQAWDQLVDRTLASPAFGERMTWDWLEAARYADSNGYQGDSDRTMWPWRDWVVSAFNDNLPFDQFTVWQLAGDLLPEASHEQILATAFNRNFMINGEGGRIPEENRVDYVMDMTETMGTVWLGLTLNCCRCHDHKFDPLLQENYYQFTAFFNQTPIDGSGGNPQTPPILAAPSAAQRQELQQADHRLKELQQAITQRSSDIQPGQRDWEASQLHRLNPDAWQILHPSHAHAANQTIEIEPSGRLIATGPNPEQDEYQVSWTVDQPTEIASLRLDALRHPSMTHGGLARSDSGNFVLTDLQFFVVTESPPLPRQLEVASATATFEQGSLKIVNAFDDDSKSGWAVWDGRPIDQDHSAVFRLRQPVTMQPGDQLRITMKFNSPHPHHHLGCFRWLWSASADAALDNSTAPLLAALQTPPDQRSSEQTKSLRTAFEAQDAQLTQLRTEQQQLQDHRKSIAASVAQVMVMQDRAELRPTFILDRGLYNQPGKPVTAAVPDFLPPVSGLSPASPSPEQQAPGAESSGQPQTLTRLQLAQWLVSRDHPLTARVTVNRLWQMLFGIGLVKTTEDFGVQGEYPVHRELLDWLAVELIESGWDIRHLLKTIVTSETYRRSSVISSPEVFERDPENRLLARGSRFRLPSWMIRDQALAVSGLLQTSGGGAPVYPYQPEGVWQEATFGKKSYPQSQGDDLYRRSLYTFWRRIIGPTLFFDTARRQACEVKSLRTNTPMHALTTLNDITYVEAARVLAEHLLQDHPTDDERLQFLGRRLFCRPPEPRQLEIWKRSLDRASQAFAGDPAAAGRFLSLGEAPRNQSLPADRHAAWTALCLNLLNTDEMLTRE